MKEEIFKDIIGYEGLYMVSNLGRVKSVERYVKHPVNGLRHIKERILKSTPDGNGYLKVILWKNGKSTIKKVHRLVAEAFIPNTENKPCIDHINTVRTDNRVQNLRWCTRKENSNNPISIEHYSECNKGEKNSMYGKFGKDNHTSKPIIQYSLDGNFIREWDCGMDIQRELGIDNSSITKCCRGKRNLAGGYVWRYKGE